MAEVSLKGYKCDRCAHEWTPRNTLRIPVVCPKCKSPYWNRPSSKISSGKKHLKKVQHKKLFK